MKNFQKPEQPTDHWEIEELSRECERLSTLGLVSLTIRRTCTICGEKIVTSAGMGSRGEVYHMSCLHNSMAETRAKYKK